MCPPANYLWIIIVNDNDAVMFSFCVCCLMSNRIRAVYRHGNFHTWSSAHIAKVDSKNSDDLIPPFD